MSSIKLDRNVLFSRKVVKQRQLKRRCLNGRRNICYEPEGAFPPGRDVRGEGEENDYKGGIGDDVFHVITCSNKRMVGPILNRFNNGITNDLKNVNIH